jgi:hypothetical protein
MGTHVFIWGFFFNRVQKHELFSEPLLYIFIVYVRLWMLLTILITMQRASDAANEHIKNSHTDTGTRENSINETVKLNVCTAAARYQHKMYPRQ